MQLNTFRDYYNNEVKFSINEQAFSEDPQHVWIITRYKNQWLLTKHGDRGMEFPGGKVEAGENAPEAAIREVFEETGGVVNHLEFIGQYYVDGKSDYIIKNVYFAHVDEMTEQVHYFETDGPVLLDQLPDNVKKDKRFSFMMRDEILPLSLKEIEKRELM